LRDHARRPAGALHPSRPPRCHRSALGPGGRARSSDPDTAAERPELVTGRQEFWRKSPPCRSARLSKLLRWFVRIARSVEPVFQFVGQSPMSSFWLVLLGMFSGTAAGLLAGLIGFGGGVVIVPVVFYGLVESGTPADQAAHVAVGTSLAAILPAALVSSLAHWRAGNTDIRFPRMGTRYRHRRCRRAARSPGRSRQRDDRDLRPALPDLRGALRVSQPIWPSLGAIARRQLPRHRRHRDRIVLRLGRGRGLHSHQHRHDACRDADAQEYRTRRRSGYCG